MWRVPTQPTPSAALCEWHKRRLFGSAAGARDTERQRRTAKEEQHNDNGGETGYFLIERHITSAATDSITYVEHPLIIKSTRWQGVVQSLLNIDNDKEAAVIYSFLIAAVLEAPYSEPTASAKPSDARCGRG